jgi:CheY-like chemotaxis protein
VDNKKGGLETMKLSQINQVWTNIWNSLQGDFKKRDDIKKFEQLETFLQEAGEFFSAEDLIEKGAIGHATGDVARFLHQMANLLAGCILFLKENSKRKKVLLIDNNPERKMVEIDTRFKEILLESVQLNQIIEWMEGFIEIYYYTKEFRSLYQKLNKVEEEEDFEIKVIKGPLVKNEKENKEERVNMNIKDFDFILVDIYLGEDEPNGIELIKLLTAKYPNIPSFALSVSDDFSIMKDAIKEGADYYILKNQIFSLLYVYYTYLKEIGEILEFLKDEKYKKNLLGNIRYWTFKKDLLWFGDKCYHMIDHSFKHTLDDWKNMNKVLVPLLRENPKDESKKPLLDLDDDLLYSFCMAVWLHDIGHKGTDVHGEPHLIRDNHGYIAGELILRYPELFRIKEKEKDDYYDNNSIDFSKVSILEMMFNRDDRNDLSITEMIALFTIYHKSNAPVDWKEYKKLLRDKKSIPLEYYKGREKKDENILTLEKILKKRVKDKDEFIKKFLRLTILFRFIDAIDIRRIRVGDVTEKALKTTLIENDREYQFRKLEKEIKRLTYSPAEQALFVKIFFQDIKEKIKSGEFIELGLPKDLLKDPQELENYESLVDYASYISFQKTHFDLHSSVKEINFICKGKGSFEIILITDKEKEKLEKSKVIERGKPIQSVYERLIGKNCYILSELKGAEDYLKDLIKSVTIKLVNERGEVYGERRWQEEKK